MTFPFPQFVPVVATATPASVSYVTVDSQDPAGTSTSLTGVSIGTAVANRYIIATLHSSKTSGSWSANPISAVTIGGVSATLAGTQVTNNASVVAIYYANVPSGTTATFAWTTADDCLRSIVGVYRAIDLVSATPTATTSSIANPPSASLTIPSNGFGIGVAAVDGASSFTWTNLTENYDRQEGAGTSSGALSSSAGTATRTATPASADKQVLSMAAWN